MKPLPVLLTLLAAASCFATIPGPAVAAKGQFRGEHFAVLVTPGEHMTPRWDPEKDDWPMSPTTAIAAARTALREMVGDAVTHFDCEVVTLKRFYSASGVKAASWYFLVVFESSHESLIRRTQPGSYTPAILPFVVFPDGHVQKPERKKA